jgi:hypothetical protein
MTLEYTLTSLDYIHVSSLIDDHTIVIHVTRSANFGGTTP